MDFSCCIFFRSQGRFTQQRWESLTFLLNPICIRLLRNDKVCIELQKKDGTK